MELGTERIRKLLMQYAVPAIIASGMVISSSLPDSPSRRGPAGGRELSLAGWLSVATDTVFALEIRC